MPKLPYSCAVAAVAKVRKPVVVMKLARVLASPCQARRVDLQHGFVREGRLSLI